MSYEIDKRIYLELIGAGLTPEGAAGSMGNMKAESGMIANIAQRGMTRLSDEEYTKAADNGTIDFVHDSVGYGLCQWTYYQRKAEFLKFAKERGKSIGDYEVQVQFFLYELQSYGGVLYILTNSHDLKQCSDIVCTEFERPAINNLDLRYQFSKEFYDQFHGLQIPGLTSPVTSTPDDKMSTEEAFNAQMAFSDLLNGITQKIRRDKKTINAKMPVFKEGDEGAGVAAIQVALKYHKIDLGTTGNLGIWEHGTTSGIKDFQAKNGLKVTGAMDADTWSKLMT